MGEDSIVKRQLSLQQRSWLARELETWQQLDIVSGEQAGKILDQYETEENARSRRGSRALFVLTGLAVLLVALAVLLLISYNWQDMPRWVKLTVIVGGVAMAHGLGWRLLSRQREAAAEVAFFFGCALYGAGIFLIAQVFHFSVHFPDGFLWWAIGVLPFAFVARSLLLPTLYIGLLAIWCGTEILGFANVWFWGYLPNGAYLLPVLALPAFAWSYRKRSTLGVALCVALVTWWVVLQPMAWRHAWGLDRFAMWFFVGSVGALLLLFADLHERGDPFARSFHIYGGLLAVGTLVPLCFFDLHEDIKARFEVVDGTPPLLILLIGLVVWRWWTGVSARGAERDGREAFWRFGVPLAILAALAIMPWWHFLLEEPVVPTILANLGTVLLASAWIRLGLQTDRGLPFAAGVGLFLVWAIGRYADLFGDIGGILGAALMFFLCGAALFAVAFYWRRRQEDGR